VTSIRILIPQQALELLDDADRVQQLCLVSTSGRGVGERNGS
jgi:hypothetical protein